MNKLDGQRVRDWWQKGKTSLRVLAALLVTRLRGRSLTVILRMTGLGDVIWCAALARQIKQRDANTRVLILCGNPSHQLVGPRRCADVDYAIGHEPLLDVPLLLMKFLAWRGVKILRPLCWNERGTEGEEIHLVEEFQDSTGLPRALTQSHVTVSARDQALARRRFAIVSGCVTVVIHSGRTWATRELGREVWQEVVDRLRAKFNWRILHVCQPRIISPSALAFVLDGVENLPNDLPLAMTAALLGVSDLFIGIDSGLLHIAGAVGTPVIGIFGSTKPELRLPLTGKKLGISQPQDCSYCQHYSPLQHWRTGCPHDLKCMSSLSAAYICGEIEKFCQQLESSARCER